MSISVIIPLYNDEKYIGKCLESVFASDHKDYEVLVIDDCSTDESSAIASKYPCNLVRLEKNAGAGNARNQGALQSTGDLLVFIDSDIVIEKETLSRFERLHVEEGRKVCMCNVHPESLTGGSAATLTAIQWNYINARLGDEASFVSTMCFSINKDAFIKIGMFKTYMSAGGEEFEIGEVMAQQNYNIFVDDTFVIHHHFQPFLTRARTLYKRTAVYAKLVAERRFKFDKGHGTMSEGFSSMLSLLGTLGLLFMFYLPGAGAIVFGMSLLIQQLLDASFNGYVINTKGFAFYLKSVFIWYCWYFAMGLGVLRGFFAYFLDTAGMIIRLPSLFFSETPGYVIFFLTNLCNARCKHCFNRNNTAKDDLSLEEIEKISKSFGDIKYITYSGGEPTLRKDIVEITEIFHKNNHIEFLNLITNGFDTEKAYVAVRDILRNCKPMFMRVNVSIDGIGELHDSIRGVPGGFKRVEATIEKIKSLKQYYPHLEVGAITTFSSYNQDHVKETIRYITQDLKIHAALNLVRGETAEDDAKRVDEKKYADASEYLKTMNSKIGGRIRGGVMRAINHMALDLIKATLETKKQQIRCRAGKKMLVIKENGKVMPCEMLAEGYGNLRDVDYDIKRLLADAKDHPKCFCTWECAMQNNVVYSPKHWPGILVRLMKLFVGKEKVYADEEKETTS